ncbi:MAG: hypothetical protein IID38_04460 [Planctomycetes bacterium]|nr:hypothetical protein [Planctomycetota bacterium]
MLLLIVVAAVGEIRALDTSIASLQATFVNHVFGTSWETEAPNESSLSTD